MNKSKVLKSCPPNTTFSLVEFFESPVGVQYKQKLEDLYDSNFLPLKKSIGKVEYESQKSMIIYLWTTRAESLLDAFLQLGRSKDKCRASRSRPFRFMGFRLFS